MRVEDVDPKVLAAEVRRLAVTDPDFVYTDQGGGADETGCSYLGRAIDDRDGRPCIIGQALQNLGVSTDELRKWERLGVGDMFDNHDGSIKWMMSVQDHQDGGISWGNAVEFADA